MIKINQTTKTIGTVILIGGSLYLGKKWWDKKQQALRDKQYGNDPAYQKATQLRNAFNPSGVDWMITFDGTIESAVLETVASLKDKAEWDRMVTVYSANYGESLIERINKELGTSDLAKFNELLQARMAGKSVTDILAPPAEGKTTANWIGKRIRLKPGVTTFKWWANKSDIGDTSKTKTAVLNLSGGKVHTSWVRDWRVVDRTTQTVRINTSTIPLLFSWITIIVEFIQVKEPVIANGVATGKYTYVWLNSGSWELV